MVFRSSLGQQGTNTRNGTADLLKGIAVLLMIQVHIMEQFADTDLYQSSLGKISLLLGGPACAPVFMAVMGYFMAASKRSFAGFISRGLMLIAGGLLLNIGRSANLLASIYKGLSDLDPWQFIFGADILTLAGLSVLATGFLRPLFKTNYVPYAIMAFAVAGISEFTPPETRATGFAEYIEAFLWGREQWSYFPLFPWFAYILAGYSFRLYRERVKWLKQTGIREYYYYAIPLWVFILLTLPWASAITSDLTGPGGYYHHGMLFFLWNLVFMVSYLVIVSLAESEYGKYKPALFIRWTGANVTVLYVIQWLIIGNLATILYRSQNLFQTAAWFPAVTLITSFLGFLYLRARSAKLKRS